MGIEEGEFRDCGLGYRSRYIKNTVNSVLSGEVDLEKIKEIPYMDARAELMKLSGVGGKVVDCICLFLPFITWRLFLWIRIFKKVLKHQYPQGFPFEKYEGSQGVLQQYIFYYDLHYPENS